MYVIFIVFPGVGLFHSLFMARSVCFLYLSLRERECFANHFTAAAFRYSLVVFCTVFRPVKCMQYIVVFFRLISEDADGDIVSNYFRRKANKYNLKIFLKSAQDSILPQRTKKGYWLPPTPRVFHNCLFPSTPHPAAIRPLSTDTMCHVTGLTFITMSAWLPFSVVSFAWMYFIARLFECVVGNHFLLISGCLLLRTGISNFESTV